MKNWKCTVCGYIHQGNEPPDKCPLCGADKSLFIPLEEGSDPAARESAPPPGAESDRQPVNKHRCTVCSYIHHDSEPPEQCPVCRAGRSKFVPFDEKSSESTASAAPEPDTVQATRKKTVAPDQDVPPTPLHRVAASVYGQRLTRWHGHPIAVHIPNGVLPMSVFFVLLAALFKSSALATAAQYNIGFVALSMPIVIGTGLIDWINGFKGRMTRVFRTKMICAGIVTLLSIVLVIWGIVRPQVYTQALAENWLFLLLHLGNLTAAVIAGWQGGKLVFKK